MPGFIPDPLIVTCNACGKSAETWDGLHPDRALECSCCPIAHDHAGLGCRPVTISATAVLRGLSAGDVLDAMADEGTPAPEPVPQD